MESQILALLNQKSDTTNKYKNNVQFPKKAFPLNKSSKQGHLSQSIDKSLSLSKYEKEALISNINENFGQIEKYLLQGGNKTKQILQEDELVQLMNGLFTEYKFDKKSHSSQNFQNFYDNMKSIIQDQAKAHSLYLISLILKHRITHDRVMRHFNLNVIDKEGTQFHFIFQSIYIILLALSKNPELCLKLNSILPKKEILLSWIDVFTEILFMYSAFNPESSCMSTGGVQPLLNKINTLIDQDLKDLKLAQELSGNIECLRENNEMFRALLFKKQHGDGEIIREQITI
ncbi:UNKNOWN [Stylonychia lemnae]|uniref:Uncharacterized protein n=1 Tax=Stylonychia lemnae TaxID=5949 RepID=A0A077ZYK2_STYLE|nr:UNKNOWN [Stylonychia lemnae]|eukprot:CDW74692.1 UNKNOWN [Stylonychia lemnae]